MNNRITLSKAMKLYNGRSMPEFILKMSLVSICIYAVIIVYKVLMILLRGDGTEELQSEMADSSLSSSFLLFSAGMISLVMSQLTFEKHMPGGKFFRTVKGGFDTYKKASAASAHEIRHCGTSYHVHFLYPCYGHL